MSKFFTQPCPEKRTAVLIHSRYLSQYVNTGDKFYDQETTLFLHRIMQLPTQEAHDIKISFPAVNSSPDISKLTPLDSSGGYILQASIEITDGNSSELKDRATQQLLAIKETLRSSVNLVPGDRLALDTRVPIRRVR
jgi:mediator of RNA polymerase II transcription subunit 18, fungi type